MKLKNFLLIIIINIAILPTLAQESIFDKTNIYTTINKDTKSVRTKIVKEEDNSFTIHLNTDSAKADYNLKPLQFDSFELGFYRAFKKITHQELRPDESGEIKLLFMDVLINTMQEEKAPRAGTLSVTDTILVGKYVELEFSINDSTSKKSTYIFTKKEWDDAKRKERTKIISREKALDFAVTGKSKRNKNQIDTEVPIINNDIVKAKYNLNFVPKSTQIEFANGYIQNITIACDIHLEDSKLQNKPVIFSNKIPIGFSSIRDYRALAKYNLYAELEHQDTLIKFKIPVSDFLYYRYNLRINTRDYCPKNDVITVALPSKSLKLYKEPTSRILEAKVYTDLLGMENGNPNGIIQTEVEKRICLITRRHESPLNTNYGIMQYIKPFANLNKLEDKDRYLELETGNLDSLKTNFLDLYQHESFRTGVEVNAFLLDAPFGKSNIHLNGGIAFGKVTGSDTTSIATAQENKHTINTLHLYGKIKFNIIPDERYGIAFSYQLGHYNVLNNNIDFMQIDDTSNNKNWLQNIEMFAFWNIGESGDLFFRYRLNSPLDNWNYNFSQVQLGYSFNITKQIKTKVK